MGLVQVTRGSHNVYLRLDRISEATSAQRGTIPLRVLLTTNATAHAAISLSSTKSLSSSDCGPTNQQPDSNLKYSTTGYQLRARQNH